MSNTSWFEEYFEKPIKENKKHPNSKFRKKSKKKGKKFNKQSDYRKRSNRKK